MDQKTSKSADMSNNSAVQKVDALIKDANLNIYGTDRDTNMSELDSRFQKILTSEINTLRHPEKSSTSSFLAELWSNNRKNNAINNLNQNQFMTIAHGDVSYMASFIEEAYRNRLLEQSDLHEVASQLIELSEAILITRDAIISADVVDGRMNRTISFSKINTSDEENGDLIPVVEKVEKKFHLLENIKKFIVPKTLEFGEYYVYVIPYSTIFKNFSDQQNISSFRESVEKETTILEYTQSKNKTDIKQNEFIDNLYKTYKESFSNQHVDEEDPRFDKAKFKEDINNIMGRISVSNESVPLPILEEGIDSIQEFYAAEKEDSTDHPLTDEFLESLSKDDKENIFKNTMMNGTGVYYKTKRSTSEENFSDIKDCYVKLLDPMKVIPVKIMTKVIGYYYIQAEDVSPLSGAVSSTLFYSKFDERRQESTIISTIAEQIVDSFDKPFLKKNIQFKELIVEALNYYNLNENRIKFQYIPVEYVQAFKIDEDEEGNGRSMIRKSLFYAKLYLMLLLFKLMSIITNSNDMKVNYIRSSGLDKNLANKVQEIARVKQSRQINMIDLFNYTTLINKVGNGNELYVPTGPNNERPIETEILSGQDIQLNTELMEMLKNSYILGTGVPAAIVNYLNEADFAKVVEQNNTKFNARVVNYQLDFNPAITELYKKILRYSTDINAYKIENFRFELQPPKTVATNTRAESISQFTTLKDFLVSIYFGDDTGNDPLRQLKVQEFTKLLVSSQLPQINLMEIDDIYDKSIIAAQEKSVTPNPDNGDNGDDMGIPDDIMGDI